MQSQLIIWTTTPPARIDFPLIMDPLHPPYCLAPSLASRPTDGGMAVRQGVENVHVTLTCQ